MTPNRIPIRFKTAGAAALRQAVLVAAAVCIAAQGCAPARVRHVKAPHFEPLETRTMAAAEPMRDVPVFPASEKLTFDVRWARVHIGTLTASLNRAREADGREMYRIETHLKSNGLLAILYRFADEYVSFVDSRTLLPLRHEVYSRHGNRRRGTVTTFDQAGHSATMRNLMDATEKTCVLPPDAHDLVSSVYHMQTLKLAAGDRIAYDVFNIERHYRLTYQVSGTAMVYVPGLMDKAREALVVEPYAYSREDGDLKRGKIKLFFFDDNGRFLPMHAEIDGPMFTKITFTLETIERG